MPRRKLPTRMSLRWSVKKVAILAIGSSAFGGVPGIANATAVKIANPIPVAASQRLPLASATVILSPSRLDPCQR